MLYFFYNCLLLIILIIYMPVVLYRMTRGKYVQGFKQRLGFLEEEVIDKFKNKPTVWFHAVSVGETVAAGPIVKEFKRQNLEYKILFSTVTDTGQKMARKIITEADEIIYFPLDFSPVVSRVLNNIDPELVILTETELWPNFIRLAAHKGIKTMLANGRISDSSAKRYKYLGLFIKDMFKNIDILSMQSEQDKKYALKLGAPSEKVYNTGNTKFDQDYGAVDEGEREELYKKFRIRREQPVLVAGSTHADEEEQLLSVYKRLKGKYPELVMIIVPRHIDRSEDISSLYNKEGIDPVTYTSLEKRKFNDDQVIIVDVIGKLSSIYAVADLVFIGGSLVDIGGHNMLEASAHGKMTFFGPNMYNFKESTELVLKSNTGIQVKDKDELTEKMLYYLAHPLELKKKGKDALKLINKHSGAARENVCLAKRLLAWR